MRLINRFPDTIKCNVKYHFSEKLEKLPIEGDKGYIYAVFTGDIIARLSSKSDQDILDIACGSCILRTGRCNPIVAKEKGELQGVRPGLMYEEMI